tara:strand:- start:165 stop:476 length:312 start_codon:yes stop_codon:yes gene_type:complete
MPKPTAHSSVKDMKEYIRSKKLNKAPVKLSMKRPEMVAALKRMGHWDPRHDGSVKPKSVVKGKKKKAANVVSDDQFKSARAGLINIMAKPPLYKVDARGGMNI